MAAISYTRVSTDQQTESGAGMAAQAAAIAAYAKANGLTITASYSDEGISGSADLDGRPGLAAAVAAIRKGDVLLVAKRDRLGRDVLLVSTIERMVNRKGASVVSCDGAGNGSTPADQFMRHMIDAASQYERGLIKARTRQAMAAMRKAGRLTGTVPFGYAVGNDNTLVAVPAEQLVIAKIEACHQAGLSLRQIAATLTAAGLVTKKGNTAWTHTAVGSILRRQAMLAA